ncbi:CbtA family protein [soil metagenome]|jgi:predicted cobalt transporter CbtA
MIGKLLARGLAAGLIAGVLAGLFALVVGEPSLERAISLEEAGSGGEDEVFGRGVQRVGLMVATALYGAAVGGVFGTVSALLRGHTASRSGWYQSLGLAASGFAGAFLLPFLKYPPNPPGAGATTSQTPAYLALAGLSLLAVFLAWRVSRRMADASPPARHLSVGGFLVVSFSALYVLLPEGLGVQEIPADLLWQFRLSSIGSQAVLWVALGGVFGLLCDRAERRGNDSESASRVETVSGPEAG